MGQKGTETTYWPETQKKKKDFSKIRERFPRNGKREHEENRELSRHETEKKHALNLSTFIHPIPVYTMHSSKNTEHIHNDPCPRGAYILVTINTYGILICQMLF